MGCAIGWSSPAYIILMDKHNVTEDQLPLIGSSMTLGAAASQILSALVLDVLGRELYMIIMAFPLMAAWVILGLLDNFGALIAGRLLLGFCAATYCVSAPTFTGEMADKDIRGTLGCMFQLLVVIGILWVYAFGELNSMLFISIPQCAAAVAMVILLFFLPESPVYLYKKNKMEQARKSLETYRGKDYTRINEELGEIEQFTKKTDEKFWQLFKKKANLKGFFLLMGLHVVQQLSGINAVMFYAHKIFLMAGGDITPGVCAITIGIVQVAVTVVAAVVVDRAGRKLLWIISLGVMCACLVLLGVFFFFQKVDENIASKMTFIPITSVAFYIAGFSLGCGPLPWAMLGEMLPDRLKGPLGSTAAFINWLLAFLVSYLFPFVLEVIDPFVVFWFFAVICALGIPYVLFLLIETKGKSLDQIQAELS